MNSLTIFYPPCTAVISSTKVSLPRRQNAVKRTPELQFPLICSQGFGRSSNFHCNFNAFYKPIFRPNSSRNTSSCHVAESQAYVAEPLDSEEEEMLIKARELESTRRLVECALFSAITGLTYFLSNLLRFENYFGAFLPLPLVISSVRWGVAAGRKTMVSTAMLLLILSGPVKAASYLLLHGFVGFAMGALWRLELSWGLSLVICTLVRCIGQLGGIFLSSWLIRENILHLIMINAHAAVSYMFAAVGFNIIPSMEFIYAVFASLLLVECGLFVFLIHLFYSKLLKYLGIKTSVSLPGWLDARTNIYK